MPPLDPSQPRSQVPWSGAEVQRRLVDRDAANVRRAIGRDEGWRWPEEGGSPLGERGGPELQLVERVPAIDAIDHNARWAGAALVRHSCQRR
jgi:hypothetical protein